MAGTTIVGRASRKESTRARRAVTTRTATGIATGVTAMVAGTGTGVIAMAAGTVATGGTIGATVTCAGVGTIARSASGAATGVWTKTATDAVTTPIDTLRGAATSGVVSTTIAMVAVTSGITATAGAPRTRSRRF